MLALISGMIFEKGDILATMSTKSPADRFGGIWELIAQGRALVGADADHALGSTGGSATHSHASGSIRAIATDVNNSALDIKQSNSGQLWTATNQIRCTSVVESSNQHTFGIDTMGSTGVATVEPPWLSVNFWKRIA